MSYILFSGIKEILYNKFPEYINKIIFLGCEKKILRNATIYENGIEDEETTILTEINKILIK